LIIRSNILEHLKCGNFLWHGRPVIWELVWEQIGCHHASAHAEGEHVDEHDDSYPERDVD